jgi:hypothetical protein
METKKPPAVKRGVVIALYKVHAPKRPLHNPEILRESQDDSMQATPLNTRSGHEG